MRFVRPGSALRLADARRCRVAVTLAHAAHKRRRPMPPIPALPPDAEALHVGGFEPTSLEVCAGPPAQPLPLIPPLGGGLS
jgi:hypothetical protein